MIHKKILNILQVQQITGLSRSTLWREERAGRFPCRITITTNRVGWEESEVLTWLDNKLANRRKHSSINKGETLS
jgi:prophage regulatory protein